MKTLTRKQIRALRTIDHLTYSLSTHECYVLASRSTRLRVGEVFRVGMNLATCTKRTRQPAICLRDGTCRPALYRFDFTIGRKLTHREWKDVWA